MLRDTDAFGQVPVAEVLLPEQGREVRSGYPVLKRFIDVAGALCVGVVALPVVLACAWIVTRDGGPAMYSQARVGRGGRTFRIWKLRTMCPDADRRLREHLESDAAALAEWTVSQKLRDDPRITRAGRWLRKYSVDELPQLWNVLVGDMSLIGPRPMALDQVDLYPDTAYYELRPGMTGLWQVSDRNACSFADRARYDTRYARSLSLWTDVVIVVRTFGVVFRGTGC